MKKSIVALAAVALLPLTTACIPESCQGLDVSDKDREAVSNGYEVEKEDGQGNECELQPDGTWEVDS